MFPALHAVGRKAENTVVNILNGLGSPEITFTDNFAGNNNDLQAGNVHLGPFAGSFAGLTAGLGAFAAPQFVALPLQLTKVGPAVRTSV